MSWQNKRAMAPSNHLYYGDNLPILRDRIPDESVDLIYLDPPFNSNATYNVLFKSHTGEAAAAQIQAFNDTWHWSQQTEGLFGSMIGGGCPPRVADALTAMRNLLGTSDMNAYLVMMTARLIELHRALKPTGSLYLHCDPTASHYLKVMLDAIFGLTNFRNEISWRRSNPKSLGTVNFPNCRDVVLRYAKTNKTTFNMIYESHDPEYVRKAYKYEDEKGRYRLLPLLNPNDDRPNLTYSFLGVTRVWRWTKERMEQAHRDGIVVQLKPGAVPQYKKYLADSKGRTITDDWDDIEQAAGNESLGYPTQKPLALMERIIAASSNEGDMVLDPFCGCGTTIDAAEKMRRRWIGIDVTYLAVDLIRKRLRHTYGDGIENTYTIHGVPADIDGARALFGENPFDFERWAVSLIDAQPNEKQRGDKGIDGRVRFHADEGRIGQVLVSVKGGGQLAPTMVRDLVGTVQRESAEMGILITLGEPTRGMRDEADKAGTYTADLTGQEYPKIQLVTIAELMAGRCPRMPTAILPYLKAKPRDPDQLTLGG